MKERYNRRFISECVGRYSFRVYVDTSKVCFFKEQNIGICAVSCVNKFSSNTRDEFWFRNSTHGGIHMKRLFDDNSET